MRCQSLVSRLGLAAAFVASLTTLTSLPASAEETFEVSGRVEAANLALRTLVIDGQAFRVPDGLSIRVEEKSEPFFLAVRDGAVIGASGTTGSEFWTITNAVLHVPAGQDE